MTQPGPVNLRKTIEKLQRKAPHQALSVSATARGMDPLTIQTEDSPQFLTASISKTVFAAITLRLAGNGQLSLEDSVGRYVSRKLISGLVKYRNQDLSDRVTIGDLLSHQSGIPDYYMAKRLRVSKNLSDLTAADPGWTREEALEIAKSMPARFAPHSGKSQYSFTNYQLLGELLERTSGRSLPELLRDEITHPLGMSDTILLTGDNLGQFEQVQPVFFGRHRYLGARRIASLGAEGAVVSSLHDVNLFVNALNSGKIVTPEQFETMLTPRGAIAKGVGYGLGIMTVKLPRLVSPAHRLPPFYGHFGASGSFMLWTAKNTQTIVGTTNQFLKIGQRIALIRSAHMDILKNAFPQP